MGNAGFAIGIALGAGIGAATGNMGAWLALGVVFGFALMAAMRDKSKPEA